MGLYDTVIYQHHCEECYGDIKEWQTKSYNRMLDHYSVDLVDVSENETREKVKYLHRFTEEGELIDKHLDMGQLPYDDEWELHTSCPHCNHWNVLYLSFEEGYLIKVSREPR